MAETKENKISNSVLVTVYMNHSDSASPIAKAKAFAREAVQEAAEIFSIVTSLK
jgi:hypothetical protein